MLRTRDLFYGQTEPVWIVKAEKDDGKDNNKKQGNNPSSRTGEGNVSYPIVSHFTSLPIINSYQLYSPEFMVPTPAPKETKGKSETDKESKDQKKKKETEVVMKVPICCTECEELVKVALYGLNGVKSVDCFSYKEMVTVVATTAAPADILLECRKLFKKSRMWSDD